MFGHNSRGETSLTARMLLLPVRTQKVNQKADGAW